jgi:hypothetical protein
MLGARNKPHLMRLQSQWVCMPTDDQHRMGFLIGTGPTPSRAWCSMVDGILFRPVIIPDDFALRVRSSWPGKIIWSPK